MRIGGFQKVSFIDFPETIASVVFTQGCNWRCPWCHNPRLVYADQFEDPIPEALILEYLKSRIGQVEGVVVSGGEPTLHTDLGEFMGNIRKLGLKTKLDTNGSHPEHLKTLLDANLLDYVAMDIKSAPESYNRLTGVKIDMTKIVRSINLIQQSNIAHEFRTTRVPHLHSKEDFVGIKKLIGELDCIRIQEFAKAGVSMSSANCK